MKVNSIRLDLFGIYILVHSLWFHSFLIKVVEKIILFILDLQYFQKCFYEQHNFVLKFFDKSQFRLFAWWSYVNFGVRTSSHNCQKQKLNSFYFHFVWMIFQSLDFFCQTSISPKHTISQYNWAINLLHVKIDLCNFVADIL